MNQFRLRDFRFLWLIVAVAVSLLISRAQARERVVYKNVQEDKELALNLYKPKAWKKEDSRAAIVFFFGGGWRGGSTRQFAPHAKRLAELGMVAITAEYRIRNKHDSTPFDSTSDAKSAMRWVRAHADELGIDPDRIAAGGGSAGGHLAAATATIKSHDSDSDDGNISAMPNALVLFNPALDLKLDAMEKNWGKKMAAKAHSISPIEHVTGKLPPTIIFHGIADSTVPYATAEAFVTKAKSSGAKQVELVGYEGRQHGFFNLGKGDGKDYQDTLQKTEEFLTRLGWIQ